MIILHECEKLLTVCLIHQPYSEIAFPTNAGVSLPSKQYLLPFHMVSAVHTSSNILTSFEKIISTCFIFIFFYKPRYDMVVIAFGIILFISANFFYCPFTSRTNA